MATDITKFKSIKDVPAGEIFRRSEDQKTLLLLDGTKVSDELIKDANDAKKLQAKAAAAGAGAASGLEAAEREEILAAAREAGVEAARGEFARLEFERQSKLPEK